MKHIFEVKLGDNYLSFYGEQLSPGWYFINETGAYEYGPFSTEEDAYKGLKEYAEQL